MLHELIAMIAVDALIDIASCHSPTTTSEAPRSPAATASTTNTALTTRAPFAISREPAARSEYVFSFFATLTPLVQYFCVRSGESNPGEDHQRVWAVPK